MRISHSIIALAALGALSSPFAVCAKEKPLYKDSKAPVELRVEDLLSRMTLHEKVMQLQNRSLGAPESFERTFGGFSVGTVHEMRTSAGECRAIIDSLNAYMRHTRLGIPVITCVEGIQGILQNGCTLFPHALAQGSTFNPELVSAMTAACAEEARSIGLFQVLSPVLDLARELRWGRIEETFGEDPYLVSEIASAFVSGYQTHGVACMPKHFVAHGSPTGGLNTASVSGGERELHNLYLYPFRKVIRNTAPMAIMSCYNAYDGVPVSGSRYYMTDILRNQLGFDGYVYSDWGSVERLKSFHYAVATTEEAARQSLLAGIDVDVDDAYRTLEQQVEEGLIDMEAIDTAVRRVLRTKFLLGLFDLPEKREEGHFAVRSPEHIRLAKAIADESAVLLQNNGILPLDLNKYKKIAVIGPNAAYAPMGDYSWVNREHDEGVTLLEGLTGKAGPGVAVSYAEGCDWWSQDESKIDEALKTAADCDVIVVAVGTRSTYLGRDPKYSTAGEGFDLSSLELPGKQPELLRRLKELGKPMVVTLISGKPLVMTWAKEHADAVLVQWYAGEQQGNALADILLGNVNPSGRLNVSFPRSTGNTPCFYNYYKTDREYGRSDRGGTYDEPARHYVFERPYALWAFGSGLSYAAFEYAHPEIGLNGDKIEVSVDVANTSPIDGKEVVQVYVIDPVSSILMPVRQLKAFKKVFVPAGETVRVKMEIPTEELTFVNEAGIRVLEPGEFIIEIGHASDDIKFTGSITI